mmetsp:Transcript_4852/g.8262  ORF Transcript_4852/g.8262 Transcript_4852/m.8262 type:complete len:635 (-) Transcript_4852:146-2050(-)
MANDNHVYNRVHLDDDDIDSESIELVQGRRGHRTLGSDRYEESTSSSSSTIIRWVIISLLMAGMYVLGTKDFLGMKDGKPSEALKHPEGHENNNFGTSFTLEQVQNTRKAALTLITMLQEYYGGKHQAERMMLQSWLNPWNFENVTGNTGMVDKIVDTMARALVTNDQKEFIIGTIGSSVAAGHDNCNFDSYERQMERTFGPVWEAAGMKLVCQNAGEGGGCGDDFANQVFCIKQNVSPNIDIAHYTWTYFEVGNEHALEARETLVRWAQMLPRQPPVHVFNTFELPGKPYMPADTDAGGSMMEYDLARYYAKYGYNAFYMRSGYAKGGYDYTTAFKEHEVNHFVGGHVGDGYHNVTRYGENEEDPNRKASLGVVMRNWHPGPLAFQFVADTFSYLYAKSMLEALDRIEAEINNGRDPLETWSAKKRKIMLKTSLPEPKLCDPLYCTVDEAPGCINYERPTYGWWGAKVEDPNDNFNPHKGELQNWKPWLDGQEKDLWHGVPKQDQAFFADRDDKEVCRHLDGCGAISATSKDSGSVVFRLPKQEVGLVVVCGCCGKDIATNMFLNNTDIEMRYNGQLLDPSTWDIWPNGKCVRLLKKFGAASSAAATTGHNYLSVKVLENITAPVRISHLITL